MKIKACVEVEYRISSKMYIPYAPKVGEIKVVSSVIDSGTLMHTYTLLKETTYKVQ